MLVDRTEAIETERPDTGRDRCSAVARLVLGSAPGVGEDAPTGEEIAGRIARLASMAAVLHAAKAAAAQCATGAHRGPASVSREEVRR